MRIQSRLGSNALRRRGISRSGAASELFSEESNPGAEMYFADSLLQDKEGRPYAAGRLKFANPENMPLWPMPLKTSLLISSQAMFNVQ